MYYFKCNLPVLNDGVIAHFDEGNIIVKDGELYLNCDKKYLYHRKDNSWYFVQDLTATIVKLGYNSSPVVKLTNLIVDNFDFYKLIRPEFYDEYTNEQQLELYKEHLRVRRANECYKVCDRGKLWYNLLTSEQLVELTLWHRAWRNVTDTLEIPKKPLWLNDKLEEEEIL